MILGLSIFLMALSALMILLVLLHAHKFDLEDRYLSVGEQNFHTRSLRCERGKRS